MNEKHEHIIRKIITIKDWKYNLDVDFYELVNSLRTIHLKYLYFLMNKLTKYRFMNKHNTTTLCEWFSGRRSKTSENAVRNYLLGYINCEDGECVCRDDEIIDRLINYPKSTETIIIIEDDILALYSLEKIIESTDCPIHVIFVTPKTKKTKEDKWPTITNIPIDVIVEDAANDKNIILATTHTYNIPNAYVVNPLNIDLALYTICVVDNMFDITSDELAFLAYDDMKQQVHNIINEVNGLKASYQDFYNEVERLYTEPILGIDIFTFVNTLIAILETFCKSRYIMCKYLQYTKQ